ncbi:MAG: hypothetical protein WD063_19830 [Pirellulales bacterium]
MHRCRRLRTARRACEELAQRAPLRFSLLAVLVLLATSAAAFQFSYDTNDDVFMTMIAAGKGFCPVPDEHLIFTNVLIGRALSRLYTAWPYVPWYGCYLLSVHYAAQVAVLYCALTIPSRCRPAADSARGVRRRLALYLVYFALVELAFLNNLQFTTTAFLAAQAGIFLVLLAALRLARQMGSAVILPLCAAVLLLAAAALVRLESLWMALLVAVPLVVFLAPRLPRRALVFGGCAVASATLLIVLATAYDRASYEHDPRWSRFLDYNRLRVKFNDYRWTSYTPETAKVFSAAGWTKNDHDMIAHWFFDDARLYSEKHLRFILEAYPWQTARLTPLYYREVCRKLLQERSVWSVLLVLPFFLASIDRGGGARWAVLGCAIMGLALVLILIFCFKLPPPRTYFPLLSFPLAAALLFPAGSAGASSLRAEPEMAQSARSPHGSSDWHARPPSSRVVLILLVVGIVMGVYHQGRRSVHVFRKRRALEAFLADARPADHKLYVSWEAALPFELISPLDNLAAWSGMPLLSLAWMQQTPWQEEIKRRFGISSLAQAMSERDDIVLVATPVHRALFVTFAKEHFQTDIEFVPVASVGENIVAGRFERRTEPGQTARQGAGAAQR